METWQKLLLAAGGAAGAATVLYLLFRDDPEADAAMALSGANGEKADGGLSKADLIQILNEMALSQKDTNARMKTLAKQMSEEPQLSFEDLYKKVRATEPADPLERRGITMAELDGPLQMNQNDPQVMMAMQALMSGAQGPADNEPAKELSVQALTDANVFMVAELRSFIERFQLLPAKGAYEMKTIMIALQATLDSKVLAKFGHSTEDMQAATQARQQELGANKVFVESHEKMQVLMEAFMKSISVPHGN